MSTLTLRKQILQEISEIQQSMYLGTSADYKEKKQYIDILLEELSKTDKGNKNASL